MTVRFGDALRVLASSATGKAGIALLLALAAISAYVLVAYPLDFGTQRWSNPAVWADNPKAVPPAWVDLFTTRSRAATSTLIATSPTDVVQAGTARLMTYRMPFDHPYDEFPQFLSFTLTDVTFQGRPPLVTLSLARPDGETVRLLRHVVPGARSGEEAPIARYSETPLRLLLNTDSSVLGALADFHTERSGARVTERDLRGMGGEQAAFGVLATGEDDLRFDLLRGEYTFVVDVTVASEGDSVGSVQAVVGGRVFGVMGSDEQGRDLAVGLLFGFPVALFIGLLASTLTTAIGTALGVISGYSGGWVDSVIQRLTDIVANVPLLPILIFMVFVLGPNLLLIILMLVAFSWPGLTILVRSMVLQLRSGQLVEATVALGASRWRIMFRHIFPQTAPYVFAQMIFFTPAAILAEAGLSFLGLGDPSIPTWGQILEQGFRTGAVYVGYWWWVLPPGLLIVLTAMAFVLLALGLEPVVNPRLRSMR